MPSKKTVILGGNTSKLIVSKRNDNLYPKADDNYCYIYLEGNEKVFTTRTLSSYQSELGSSLFFRCDRTHLVNILDVNEILSDNGKASIVLKNRLNIDIYRSRVRSYKAYLKAYSTEPLKQVILSTQ